MKNKIEEFEIQKKRRINKIVKDKKLEKLSNQWMRSAFKYNYQYNFNWLGIPIIRLPSDIVVFQEVVYSIKPDLIIETGVAHGGSLILSASLINLLNNNGEVVGVDVDIRKHNKKRLEKHPLYKLITLYEGDSCDKKIIDKISKHVKKRKKILVVLDSNHTHSHVLNELNLYSKFISKNSYIII